MIIIIIIHQESLFQSLNTPSPPNHKVTVTVTATSIHWAEGDNDMTGPDYINILPSEWDTTVYTKWKALHSDEEISSTTHHCWHFLLTLFLCLFVINEIIWVMDP